MLVKNDICEVNINGYTHEGFGVGKIDELTVFVPGVLEGEKVSIKLVKVKRSYAIGKLLNSITISQNRETPFCEQFNRCGGCDIQHFKYIEQLKFKFNLVKNCIERIGKIRGVELEDIIGMKLPLMYRNKAQYPVSISNGIVSTGFYAKKTHEVVINRNCQIQREEIESTKKCIIEVLREFKVSIYNEKTHKGLIRHIVVKYGFRTDELLLIIVINGDHLPYENKIIDNIVAKIKVKGIVLNINIEKNNVVMGRNSKCIYGKEYIFDYIGKYKFIISSNSFFQINPVQTEILYKKVLEFADLTGKETVFDMYCGIGTIAIFLSEHAEKVIGVELVAEAVKNARKNANLNEIENIKFIEGKAEDVARNLYQDGYTADVVVIDPPRKGCDNELIKTLIDMNSKKIIYVSCNPSTLARDLNVLCNDKYKVKKIQLIDMFPHTVHVESVVLLERNG